jgi:hypothetical protein
MTHAQRVQILGKVPAWRNRGGWTASTLCLCLAGVLQLSLFGFGSYQVKALGDLILFSVLCFRLFSLVFHTRQPGTATIAIGIAYLVYVCLEVAYSVSSRGELLLTLQEARRWVFAGIYFILLSSVIPFRLNRRVLLIAVAAGYAAAAVAIVLLRSGWTLPGAASGLETQGGLQLVKPWLPGSLLLYMAPILAIPSTVTSARLSRALLSGSCVFVGLLVAMTLAPFRGYVISAVSAALIVAVFAALIDKSRRGYLRVAVIVVATFGSPVVFERALAEPRQWLGSAYTDLVDQANNIEYRNRLFVSRLKYLLDAGDPTRLVAGYGFVHPASAAAGALGFSTETSDSGWVEVLLTGGWSAAICLGILYCAGLFHFVRLAFALDAPIATVPIGIWCMCGLLCYTSNPLLWDFGYVPVTFVCALALNCSVPRHAKRTCGRGAETPLVSCV